MVNRDNRIAAAQDDVLGFLVANVHGSRRSEWNDYWLRAAHHQGDMEKGRLYLRELPEVSTEEMRKYFGPVEEVIERAGLTWNLDDGDELPEPPDTVPNLAKAYGIDEARFTEIWNRRQYPQLHELIAIAYAEHMDLATLLMPPITTLEADSSFEFRNGAGKSLVKAHEWVLWLRGLAPLPGQSWPRYREALAVPSLHDGSRRLKPSERTLDVDSTEFHLQRRFQATASGAPALRAAGPESQSEAEEFLQRADKATPTELGPAITGLTLRALVHLRDLVNRGRVAPRPRSQQVSFSQDLRRLVAILRGLANALRRLPVHDSATAQR